MCVYSIWLLFPSVQSFLGARFAIAGMGIFAMAVLCNRVFLKSCYKQFFMSCILSSIISAHFTMVYSVGLANFMILFPQIFMLFFPALFVQYCKHKKYAVAAVYMAFIGMLVTSIISVLWLIKSPNAARTLGFGTADQQYLKYLMSLGIGGFGFSYAVAFSAAICLYFAFVYKKNWIKLLFFCAFFIFAINTILSKYFLAIFILFFLTFGILLHFILQSIFQKCKKEYRWYYTFIAILLISIVIYILLAPILNFVYNILIEYEFQDYASKVLAIKYVAVDHIFDSLQLQRFNNYLQGIHTIVESPWIGIRIDRNLSISGHSTFIDLMADSGIPASVFTFSCFIALLNIIYKDMIFKSSKFIIYWILAALFILSAFNVIIYMREVFLVISLLPLFLHYHFQE